MAQQYFAILHTSVYNCIHLYPMIEKRTKQNTANKTKHVRSPLGPGPLQPDLTSLTVGSTMN